MTRVMLMSGGTGFLMFRLAKRFLEEGHRVIFLTRSSDQSPEERMRHQLGDFKRDQWRVVAGNITKPLWGVEKDDLERLKKEVTELWHGAALVSFDSRKKELAQATNVEGTRNALALAEYFGVPLHYISTAYIALENADRVAEEAPFCRGHLRNIYEETKCDAELLIHQWQEEKKGSVVIYRPAILIGDSRTGEAQGFTGYYMPARFLNTLKNYQVIFFIPYVRHATLNIIPVDWAVLLIAEISQHPEARGHIFHITHPQPPLLQFLFSHAFEYFHMKYVFLIPIPAFIFHFVVTLLGMALSLLPFRWARKIEKQFMVYIPYFSGDPHFSQENSEHVLGHPIVFPPITKKILDCCLDYAISHNFGVAPS